MQTIEQLLDAHGLNWSVESRQAMTDLIDGVSLPIPRVFYAYRSDKKAPLPGVTFSKKYKTVSNAEMLAPLAKLVGDANAQIVSAAALSEGVCVTVTARLPGFVTIGTESLEKLIVFTTTHDAKSALRIQIMAARQMADQAHAKTWLMPERVAVSVPHNAMAGKKLAQFDKIVGATNTYFDMFEKALQSFSTTMPNDADVAQLSEIIIPIKKVENPVQRKVTELQRGLLARLIAPAGSTWYALYTRAIEYLEREVATKRNESAWKSRTLGDVALTKVKVFQYVSDATGAGTKTFKFMQMMQML